MEVKRFKIAVFLCLALFLLPTFAFADEFSHLRAYRGDSVQSIPNNAYTKIQLNKENFDTQNEFDPVTNYRFTAKKAGYYQVNASFRWQTIPDGAFYVIAFFKNGALVSSASFRAGSGGWNSAVLSDLIYFAVDDYLELYVFQNTGTSKDIDLGSGVTFLSISSLPLTFSNSDLTDTNAILDQLVLVLTIGFSMFLFLTIIGVLWKR
jgi:hypothetical protein